MARITDMKNHSARRGEQFREKKKAQRRKSRGINQTSATPLPTIATLDDHVPCIWALYGCTQLVESESAHSDNCVFKYHGDIQENIQQLSNYRVDERVVAAISEALKETGGKYAAVEMYEERTPAIRRDIPFCFPASECWEARGAPTPGDLDQHVLSSLPDGPTKLRRILTILRQLNHEDHTPTEVQFALNMKPDAILSAYPLALPSWLSNLWSDHTGDIGMNATPRFSLVDLHCDRELSTVSISLGQQVKIWLLWPPSPSNLEVFFEAREDSNRSGQYCFPKITHLLQEGKVIIADQSLALYVPAGWLHLVYTVRGGYLTEYTFSGTEDLPIFVQCVLAKINVCADIEDLKETIKFLIKVFERQLISVEKQRVYYAAEQWIKVITAMTTAAQERGLIWNMALEIKRALGAVAKANPINLGQDCPCGAAGSGKRFFQHFKTHCL